MKVYRIVLMVIDFDSVGKDMGEIIENASYPNDCLSPHLIEIDSREIGEWADSHPLNKRDGQQEEFHRIFGHK